MIEARIVEASDTFAKNLGARLGLVQDARMGNAQTFAGGHLGIQTGAELSTTAQTVGPGFGATTLVTGTPTLVPNAQQVNLPASGLSGFSAGLFSLILFKRDFSRFLTAEISALEADGKGKIISSPRVLTANQVEALIEQGVEIPYQQATSSGATSVAFRKANLSLKVKPQITPDGNVIMTLDINKDAQGATIPQVGVLINTKHVKTEVLVENGGTVVIGGIYEQVDRTDVTQIPFLGDLPYVGFLFRNKQTQTSKTELLVFITPRIVNERLTIR
jgi:type IV pilus assembly protein PilQ